MRFRFNQERKKGFFVQEKKGVRGQKLQRILFEKFKPESKFFFLIHRPMYEKGFFLFIFNEN